MHLSQSSSAMTPALLTNISSLPNVSKVLVKTAEKEENNAVPFTKVTGGKISKFQIKHQSLNYAKIQTFSILFSQLTYFRSTRIHVTRTLCYALQVA